MNQHNETIETWNNIASLYEERFMDLDYYNESYDFVCESLKKPHARVLEIGCGPGNITKYFLTKKPDLDWLGTDVAPNMIALAKKNNPTAQFRILDARAINQLDIQADLIVCGFCVPYLSPTECRQFFEDASKLLTLHGMLYVSFVAGDPQLSEFKTSSGGRVYFQYHTVHSIVQYLHDSDFTLLKTFHVNYPKSETDYEEHTILVAGKNGSEK
ncbi:MAG TPA: class I SAM-dependent methyltransferase [Chitinophagaceae bacterium]|nr:class I SAM-dependent methyltransferase [Chitinophagaceae bacterium]